MILIDKLHEMEQRGEMSRERVHDQILTFLIAVSISINRNRKRLQIVNHMHSAGHRHYFSYNIKYVAAIVDSSNCTTSFVRRDSRNCHEVRPHWLRYVDQIAIYGTCAEGIDENIANFTGSVAPNWSRCSTHWVQCTEGHRIIDGIPENASWCENLGFECQWIPARPIFARTSSSTPSIFLYAIQRWSTKLYWFQISNDLFENDALSFIAEVQIYHQHANEGYRFQVGIFA